MLDGATAFTPDLGVRAQCSYSEAPEIGCDAIMGKEYVAVRGSGPGMSTGDAVAVLRAALAYASKSGA